MACFAPLQALKLEGQAKLVFRPPQRGDKVLRELEVPCGQCVGCRLERSRQWAVRCMHESQLYDQNCFITLTYDDENLPQFSSLRYRDYQLFMKRLRKRLGRGVRFYMCGEYGETTFRPHYHALLFGWRPSDLKLHSKRASGSVLYTSNILSEIWTDGFASVGELTFESAAYVARYVMKKVTGDSASSHYERLDLNTGEIQAVVPEFNCMSRKPGIAAGWLAKFAGDVYPHDEVSVRGVWCKPPRYYDKIYAEANPIQWESIEFERQKAAMACADDNTPDRLRTRELVTRARLKLSKRSLE